MSFCCINRHTNSGGRIWCNVCESLIIGARIDDYAVDFYVGRGNMSSVYLARQLSLSRRVAIKVLPPLGESGNVQDFRSEAALLASLTHPFILPIYSYGIVNELHSASVTYSPYLVLPYARQGSLADAFLREGKRPWPLRRVLPVIEEAAEALEYAHIQGILHRDVKPANLLLMGTHIMLADFGVSSLIDTNKSHLTVPWAGSPGYMAPEVWLYHPGRYSDQYALAVTCFLLLTGEYPWQPPPGGGLKTWSYLHRTVPPRSLSSLRSDLPVGVGVVIQHALMKEPHARYPTLRDFAADLKEATQEYTLPPALPLRMAGWTGSPPAGPMVAQPAPEMQSPAPLPAAAQTPMNAQPQTPGYPSPPPTQQQPRSMPIPIPLRMHSAELLAGLEEKDRWTWKALALATVVYLFLAGQVYLTFRSTGDLKNFLLIACPLLLIAPVVARYFRHVAPSLPYLGLYFGLLFGLTNVFCSTLICYGLTTLWLTFQHWNRDWVSQGQGLAIFKAEALKLAAPALPLILAFLVLSLIGGALIGLCSTQKVGRRSA